MGSGEYQAEVLRSPESFVGQRFGARLEKIQLRTIGNHGHLVRRVAGLADRLLDSGGQSDDPVRGLIELAFESAGIPDQQRVLQHPHGNRPFRPDVADFEHEGDSPPPRPLHPGDAGRQRRRRGEDQFGIQSADDSGCLPGEASESPESTGEAHAVGVGLGNLQHANTVDVLLTDPLARCGVQTAGLVRPANHGDAMSGLEQALAHLVRAGPGRTAFDREVLVDISYMHRIERRTREVRCLPDPEGHRAGFCVLWGPRSTGRTRPRPPRCAPQSGPLQTHRPDPGDTLVAAGLDPGQTRGKLNRVSRR